MRRASPSLPASIVAKVIRDRLMTRCDTTFLRLRTCLAQGVLHQGAPECAHDTRPLPLHRRSFWRVAAFLRERLARSGPKLWRKGTGAIPTRNHPAETAARLTSAAFSPLSNAGSRADLSAAYRVRNWIIRKPPRRPALHPGKALARNLATGLACARRRGDRYGRRGRQAGRTLSGTRNVGEMIGSAIARAVSMVGQSAAAPDGWTS
jgi:hypothetical protein